MLGSSCEALCSLPLQPLQRSVDPDLAIGIDELALLVDRFVGQGKPSTLTAHGSAKAVANGNAL
jgi:hypothetical protein